VTRKQDNAEGKITAEDLKKLLAEDRDLLKTIVEETLPQVLEAEMDEALQASKGERTVGRLRYRTGYYNRMLVTRVGHIELRVPQDRQGRFRTEIFERYQRSGVSTRKVETITEELCGHEFSSSRISRIVQKLDEELERFARRRLEEPYPYLILDARYEKVREDGAVRSQAVLIAIGINWEGRRNILAVELASRESLSSWKELLAGLRQRWLHGVEFVVSDDHAGLRRAIEEVLPEAVWQRCYVHFLRNALDYLPRKADDDCLQELRWIYDRRHAQEARQDLAAWLLKWGKRYAKLCTWVEENTGNIELLSAAAATSQKSEINQRARAAHGGDQAKNAGGADLSECHCLLAADAGLGRRDKRKLD
jgi:putative transposase